jgi:hypothetical protein
MKIEGTITIVANAHELHRIVVLATAAGEGVTFASDFNRLRAVIDEVKKAKPNKPFTLTERQFNCLAAVLWDDLDDPVLDGLKAFLEDREETI